MLPYLSDEEIAGICEPLVNAAAQIRYLQRLGLIVNRKPNGRPLVARGEFERVLVGGHPRSATSPPPAQLDREALMKLFEEGRARRPKRKAEPTG